MIEATNGPCSHARTIAELKDLASRRDDPAFDCNYALGERLFLDLYRTLGEAAFWKGFRKLYLAPDVEEDADGGGTPAGVEQVREAFGSASQDAAGVIARWYDGSVPYGEPVLDSSPADPTLPTISGRIDEAYIVTETDGPAVTQFSAADVSDWVYLTLKHSYSVSGATREVALEIVEYFEDGFVFRRRTSDITAEAQYTGFTNWYSVGLPRGEWAPGRYGVHVYSDGRKLVEIEYTVEP